jgi:hypothetical protein
MTEEIKEEIMVILSECQNGAYLGVIKGMAGFDVSEETTQYITDILYAIVRGRKNGN